MLTISMMCRFMFPSLRFFINFLFSFMFLRNLLSHYLNESLFFIFCQIILVIFIICIAQNRVIKHWHSVTSSSHKTFYNAQTWKLNNSTSLKPVLWIKVMLQQLHAPDLTIFFFFFLKSTSSVSSLIFLFERQVVAAAIAAWFYAVTVVTFSWL